ncbi:MAG: DUF2207 domain-containing protein [Alphaproteobacteria bacterium]|nr:DUF2207 domain-containing protein [Alphaproteobacteria bacterium]
MGRLIFLGAVLGGVAATAASGPASAAERITDFKSDIAIAHDGSLTVTEVIAADVEDTLIKHGLFRVLAVTRGGRDKLAIPLRVLRVARDGHPEPYRVISGANTQTIATGDKDTLVAPGPHLWLIAYQLRHQVKSTGGQYDRLFMDVVGAGWPLPIAKVSATVRLPPAAVLTYSSVDGGTKGVESLARHPPQMAAFHSAHPLKAHEGMTLSVDIPRGVVQAEKQ